MSAGIGDRAHVGRRSAPVVSQQCQRGGAAGSHAMRRWTPWRACSSAVMDVLLQRQDATAAVHWATDGREEHVSGELGICWLLEKSLAVLSREAVTQLWLRLLPRRCCCRLYCRRCRLVTWLLPPAAACCQHVTCCCRAPGSLRR